MRPARGQRSRYFKNQKRLSESTSDIADYLNTLTFLG
jgi:hypothetical protein